MQLSPLKLHVYFPTPDYEKDGGKFETYQNYIKTKVYSLFDSNNPQITREYIVDVLELKTDIGETTELRFNLMEMEDSPKILPTVTPEERVKLDTIAKNIFREIIGQERRNKLQMALVKSKQEIQEETEIISTIPIGDNVEKYREPTKDKMPETMKEQDLYITNKIVQEATRLSQSGGVRMVLDDKTPDDLFLQFTDLFTQFMIRAAGAINVNIRNLYLKIPYDIDMNPYKDNKKPPEDALQLYLRCCRPFVKYGIDELTKTLYVFAEKNNLKRLTSWDIIYNVNPNTDFYHTCSKLCGHFFLESILLRVDPNFNNIEFNQNGMIPTTKLLRYARKTDLMMVAKEVLAYYIRYDAENQVPPTILSNNFFL